MLIAAKHSNNPPPLLSTPDCGDVLLKCSSVGQQWIIFDVHQMSSVFIVYVCRHLYREADYSTDSAGNSIPKYWATTVIINAILYD